MAEKFKHYEVEERRWREELVSCQQAHQLCKDKDVKGFAEYLEEVDFNYLNYISGNACFGKGILQESHQVVPQDVSQKIGSPYNILCKNLDLLIVKTAINPQLAENGFWKFFFQAAQLDDSEIVGQQMVAMAKYLFCQEGKETRMELINAYGELSQGLLQLGQHFDFSAL